MVSISCCWFMKGSSFVLHEGVAGECCGADSAPLRTGEIGVELKTERPINTFLLRSPTTTIGSLHRCATHRSRGSRITHHASRIFISMQKRLPCRAGDVVNVPPAPSAGCSSMHERSTGKATPPRGQHARKLPWSTAGHDRKLHDR